MAAHGYLVSLLISALVLATSLTWAAPPSAEIKKIEMLIEQVRDLKDAEFVRNGSSYNSKHAATFLRRKWQANGSSVQTARDFIDKVASESGTSGKPYLIRFNDGKEIQSREFLLARLQNLENAP
jgi:hypothetical protein